MAQPPDFALPPALLASPGARVSPVLAIALVGAVLLHLFLILAIELVPPAPPPIPEMALEVLILKDNGQIASQPPPDGARSQRNRIGTAPSGDAVVSRAADRVAPTEPIVAPPRPAAPEPSLPDPPVTAALPEPPASPPPPVLVATAPPPPELPPLPRPDPLAAREIIVDAAQILVSRGLEIDRLTANLDAHASAYASRVRRKSVSASTREFRYASYLGAWARKVERIGNINYPAAAKEQHLYGSLILHVAVRADGSVENIRVVRSSGFTLLDEAAMQIVALAAPYSPFPPDIAAETDVLDIIRTWQFMRGDVLGWER